MTVVMAVVGVGYAGWKLSSARRLIELDSPDPYWIASIDGTRGDRALIWIWTPGPMRVTEVPIPFVIRLNRSDLLLQVKSAALHGLRVEVGPARGHGTVKGATEDGSSNSVVFVSSVNRLPFGSGDEFSIHSFPGTAPLGLRPLYSPPWDRHHSGYDLVEPLPTPAR